VIWTCDLEDGSEYLQRI